LTTFKRTSLLILKLLLLEIAFNTIFRTLQHFRVESNKLIANLIELVCCIDTY